MRDQRDKKKNYKKLVIPIVVTVNFIFTILLGIYAYNIKLDYNATKLYMFQRFYWVEERTGIESSSFEQYLDYVKKYKQGRTIFTDIHEMFLDTFKIDASN